jgi:hypothetical protein
VCVKYRVRKTGRESSEQHTRRAAGPESLGSGQFISSTHALLLLADARRGHAY